MENRYGKNVEFMMHNSNVVSQIYYSAATRILHKLTIEVSQKMAND